MSNDIQTPKMPGQSEDEIERLEKSLDEVFGPDQKLVDSLCSELRATKDVEKTLLVILNDSAGLYAGHVKQQAQMLTSVYRLAEKNVDLTAYLWPKNIPHLNELARSYYNLPEDAPTSNSWKANLFSIKPTSVLLGLLAIGKIKIPDTPSPGATELAIKCLEFAVDEGYDIRKTSARHILGKFFSNISLKSPESEESPEIKEVLESAGISPTTPEIRGALETGSPGTYTPKTDITTTDSTTTILQEAKDQVAKFICDIQRTQALVREPEDIGLLLDASYNSAHSIAVEDDEVFAEIMVSGGMSEDSARRIYDHATSIEIRNEQAWAIALRKRNELTLPHVTVKHQEVPGSAKTGVFSSAQNINITNLFRDMDSIECSDCSSVLSPSAYFVDLLRLLQETQAKRKDKTSSLFQKLMDRRPDMQHLELSCANTNTPIAYIDLANEVMESYIDHLSGRKEAKEISILVQNTPNDEADDTGATAGQPRHVNYSIYQRLLQSEVYPMTCFPYNQAVSTIRTILQAAGSSRHEVMSVFSSTEMALNQIKPPAGKIWSTENLSGMKKNIQAVQDRALAAEYLGLQQEDFMAVTREAFHPMEILQEQRGPSSFVSIPDYWRAFNVKSTHELWGYDASEDRTAEELMLDEETGKGLTFIKAELLPRSGLTFNELLSILKTHFFSSRLVITTGNSNNVFTGRLDDMRLRCSTLEDSNSSKLTEYICHDLQAFIRLWRKVGWSITDLDAILSTLKRKSESECDLPFPSRKVSMTGSLGSDFYFRAQSTISPQSVENLAAVKRLVEMYQIEPSRLQPLWGDIDTNGPGSLYASLFLPARMTKMDPVFKADTEGKYLKFAHKIMFGQHKQVILATLRVLEKDLPALYKSSGLESDPVLTLGNISAIYRTSVFCKLIGIEAAEYPAFCKIFQDQDFFEDPRATLRTLEKWRMFQEAGWTVHELAGATDITVDDELKTRVFIAIKKILGGVAVVEKTFAIDGNEAQASSEDVSKFSSLIFDSSSAKLVSQLIEGKWSTSSELPIDAGVEKDPVTVKLATKLSFQIDFGKPTKARVALKGLLSKQEMVTAKNLLSKNEKWQTALALMNEQALKIFQTLIEKVAITDIQEAEDAFTSSNEGAIDKRRRIFLQHALPVLRSQQLRQSILDNVSIDFPIDAALFLPLLTEVVHTKEGTPALNALLELSSQQPSSSTSFTGFLLPQVSGNYTFLINTATTPIMTINGIALEFRGESASWAVDCIKLLSGKSYSIFYGGDVYKDASFVPAGAPTAFPFTAEILVPQNVAETVGGIYSMLQMATKIIQRYKLSQEEVEFFVSPQTTLPMSLVQADVDQLPQLSKYCSVRDSCSEAQKSGETIMSFFEWVSRAKSNPAELQSKLCSATGWPSRQVADIISAKYSSWNETKLMSLFKDANELFQMSNMIQLIAKTNLPTIQIYRLFYIATPLPANATLPPLDDDLTFENAAALRLAAQAMDTESSGPFTNANNAIREHQRNALIQYLLNHAEIKKLNLIDADSLFEWFLIDVQMGAKLQTSRMKQAISTVQLYIQRCMLGLEKVMGVECDTVSKVRWKYMSKYTLWEANRKLFLYPENWIDPTLRDNKTDLFKALEVSILQSNLNDETISAAIKSYIYGVNEIADLSIQSYIWEKKDDNKGTFHFFARTRQNPYQYYYRKLDLKMASAVTTPATDATSGDTTKAKKPRIEVLRKWDSWSKVEIDIPALDTDADGSTIKQPGSYLVPVVSRGRLFLFIPSFLLKSPTKDSETTSLETRAKSISPPTVKKFWEIKMGRSEYRNGKWSPKQTSANYLQVPGQDAPSSNEFCPSLSSFKFFTNTYSSSKLKHQDATTDDVIFVDVECWYDDSKQGVKQMPSEPLKGDQKNVKRWSIGRFKVQGTKVTAIHTSDVPAEAKRSTDDEKKKFADDDKATALERQQLTDLPNDYTIPTYFSKIWARSTELETPAIKPIIRRGIRVDEVLLARTAGQSIAQRDYLWTMSFNSAYVDRITGLVLEVSTRTHNSTYLAFPTDEKASWAEGVESLDHPLMAELMECSTTSSTIDSVFNFLSSINDASKCATSFGRMETGYNEQATSYSVYNWELGMHVVSLIMERLLATQQFDLALSVARLVFDPTIDGTNLERCWRFLPFRDTALAGARSVLDILNELEPKNESVTTNAEVPINEWKENPFVSHSIARGRPVVYMKRFVLKYIEILVASGDQYFRQNSLESIPLAIQRYVEASHLFGPSPQQIPKLGKLAVKTFSKLDKSLDVFGNAKVDMELDFPYSSEPCYRGVLKSKQERETQADTSVRVMGMVKTGYFCVPPNPKVTALRNLIDDRFYKIRNSMDIAGKPLTLALFDPPLDPGLLAMAEAAGLSPSVLLNDLEAPMPNYRFMHLLQKAMDMCTELKSMGDQFLAAKEKKDAEALNLLHARQDVLTNTTLLPIKELQKMEVSKSIISLEEMRKSHANRLAFYLALIGESTDKIPDENSEWIDLVQSIDKPSSDDLRMSPYEKVDMDKADSAAKLTDAASILDLTAAGLLALPNLTTNMQPMGVGVQLKIDAENAAQFMMGTATFMKLKAQMDSHDGQRASRKGAMVRQLQDRTLQANQAAHDLKHVDKDIAVQRVRLAVCDGEIRAQKLQIERASEVQNWYRTKYTNETLYAWLENSFRTLYYETFLLTMQLARRAERAFQFENPSRRSDKLAYLGQGGYWDSGRDGLLSAQNLYLSLKRLEMAHVEKRSHDFELVKNVSLRQIDPIALIALRQDGTTQFSLPEVLFDLDFPGHYMRRIKSVSVSIPCIVGPYTGLNCTLSLLEHQMRTSVAVPYAYQGRDDSRFSTDRIPISSIAMSSGQNDSGLFELSFHDERYLPFEGAGAISKWKLEFPAAIHQFDYSTISDVVLHVKYTSLDGGSVMRQAANTSINTFIGQVQEADKKLGGFFAFFDLRNDYSNEWYKMQVGGFKEMRFGRIIDRLPFWARSKSLAIQSSVLIVSKPSDKWATQINMNVKSKKDGKSTAVTYEVSTETKIKDVTVLMGICKENITPEDDFVLNFSGDTHPENVYLVIRYTCTPQE